MPEETAAFPAHSSKAWKHKWSERLMFHLKNSLIILPFLFVFILLWTAGRLWCKCHLANGLKALASQKAVCPSIHNPLADTSALAWLLVCEDFRSSYPVNGVSNGWIVTFLQTSPNISAVRFLSSLCLVIISPPFEKDKACCKLNETPQTHSVNKLVYIEGKIASVCF